MEIAALQPVEVKTESQKFQGTFCEPGVAMAGTAFMAVLLFLTTLNAGPLWRDETNTINIAQMPSLTEFRNNMPFESFPALYLLVLRGYSFLGMADTDAGIRTLGFFIGLAFLGSLWFTARSFGARAPILSIVLLGGLPYFLFTLSSNRAYGLAMCLLVLCFGILWRVVQSPTRARIIWWGVVSLLFLHCLYYDVVFWFAMLCGAALLLARRRQWKGLAALAGVSVLAGSSLLIYLPIVARASLYAPLIQVPFHLWLLWYKLVQALTESSSGQFRGMNSGENWLWILVVAIGIMAAITTLLRSRTSAGEPTLANDASQCVTGPHQRADLALFSVVALLVGTAGYILFLLKLRFPTEPWYYMGVLTLGAISLEAMLTANWQELRPWGLLRTGFAVLFLVCGAKSMWHEAHTRRSNVDLIATVLGRATQPGDLIVVQGAWEGLTFDRYYQGRARWVTVPPLDSHKVHRNDLMMEKMNQADPMGPVLTNISTRLKNGKTVWVVGHLIPARPGPPAQPSGRRWLGEYMGNWGAQLTAHLSTQAREMKSIEIPLQQPVSAFENLPLVRFSGYQTASDSNGGPEEKKSPRGTRDNSPRSLLAFNY